MHINVRPWLSVLILSMYSRCTNDGSRGRKKRKDWVPQWTWSRDTSGGLIWRLSTCTFLSFSFFKVLKVSMNWNHIVFSSITLALRYKKSATGTFRKGPQTDPCPHFKRKSPPDTRRRSEAPRCQWWQKACVHCCSCWDGKPESSKSKCCFYLCHCLTLMPRSIHLDIFHPETLHKESKSMISVLTIGCWLVFHHGSLSPSSLTRCTFLYCNYKNIKHHVNENTADRMGQKRQDGDIHIDTSRTFHSLCCYQKTCSSPRQRH